jgi:L-threonylcarbamoyladenylate synthase
MTNPIQISQAAAVLHSGGVIAYPTEGVYGLGCLPENAAAVQHILAIKRRKITAGLILIAPDYELLEDWLAPSAAELRNVLSAQSSPVTWIVNAAAHTPVWLTGGRTSLAVRITQHPIVSALCDAADSALVSTSANRTGHPAARTALQVRYWLGKQLDYVVSGALGGAAGASEIRVALDGKVIRPKLTTRSS